MAKDVSFDVVSKIDLYEVDNAIHQAMKEVETRFDFKGSRATINRDGHTLTLQAEDRFKIRALLEILEAKLVRRGVPLKGLTRREVEPAAGGTVRQELLLQQGIPVEKGREIVKLIKGTKLKVQAHIQEDQVRVSGPKKDDLQAVIQMLRGQDLGIHMEFVNYR